MAQRTNPRPLRPATRSVAAVALALCIPCAAHARDAACPDVNVRQWQQSLDDVDNLYASGDVNRASVVLIAIEDRVPCLVDIARPEVVARFAQQMSYSATLAQDQDQSTRWAQLSRLLDPELALPFYVPPDHAFASLLSSVEQPQISSIDGKGLVFPTGGGVFMNGGFLARPTAPVEVPLLMQVADGDGEIVRAFWQDGAGFPEDLLGPEPASLPAMPEWYKVRWGPSELKKSRTRTALILGATGAGLYLGSWGLRGAYNGNPNNGLYVATNGTYVASAGVGVAAAGMLTAALLTR